MKGGWKNELISADDNIKMFNRKTSNGGGLAEYHGVHEFYMKLMLST